MDLKKAAMLRDGWEREVASRVERAAELQDV